MEPKKEFPPDFYIDDITDDITDDENKLLMESDFSLFAKDGSVLKNKRSNDTVEPTKRLQPGSYMDDTPNEVNKMLVESSLSLNYGDFCNLAITDKITPAQLQIDALLSKDLLKLSVQDQNAIDEEIHGVHTIAPEESPSMISAALKDLNARIDEIPAQRKVAYLKSQELIQYPVTHINSDEFRLRFLRRNLFDAKKAAAHMVAFLDLVTELFGDFVLKRPLRISDFNYKEMQILRRGHFQLMPYRDRGGRRIFAAVGGFAAETCFVSRVSFLLVSIFRVSRNNP